MNKEALFSHKTDDWATPKYIYNHFINDLKCVDPCPLYCQEDNTNKLYYDKLFINPPYSKIEKWVDFIKANLFTCRTIFLLIPARTDTTYFHNLMNLAYCHITLYFIKGRLQFGDSKKSAPFPSVLIRFTYYKYAIIHPLINVRFITKEDIANI